jgi:hypothetical protein
MRFTRNQIYWHMLRKKHFNSTVLKEMFFNDIWFNFHNNYKSAGKCGPYLDDHYFQKTHLFQKRVQK